MATVLEARAVITAEDKTGPAFAAIEARMAAMSRAAANMSRVAAPMSAGAREMERVAPSISRATKAMNDYGAAMGNAADKWKTLAAAQKNAAGAIELGSRAAAHAKAMHAARSYAGTAGMIATPFIAHEAARAASAVLGTYREYDKERRFAKAVMGISDAEQAPLIAQAIRGGATTKYNDIQFLEGQRDLAARGLHKEQILGFMGAAADLGQSLDLSLPASVKQMEGAIFGFKKDISTVAAATAAARQTADIQVKAAKISGMTPEDLSQVYKFGATPARLAGVSEATLLAFGAMSKKANMGGDEAGTAFRAFIAAAESPTSGARTAMRAHGMRYADYQHAPKAMEVEPFVADIAERYGVKLDKNAQGALGKIFSNKDLVASPEKFTPAVMSVLRNVLGGADAKSLKSIAGEAGRYRAASIGGVDVNALLADLLVKIPGNLPLSNALFGAKQGARIANALSDPDTMKHMLDELNNHSQGYAEKVSKERMAGFDGAVSRFEGSIKNLETALGRSFDKPLTGGYDAAGKFVQSLAEMPPAAHRTAIELAAVASAAVMASGAIKAFSIANRLDGGPGVKGPGMGGMLGYFWKGAVAYNLASSLWDPNEMENNFFHRSSSLSDKVDRWGRRNLPSWIAGTGYDAAPAPDGFKRDFTLDSGGGFSKGGRLQPTSGFGNLESDSRARAADTVNVTGQAEVSVMQTIKVEASKYFEALVDRTEKAVASVMLSSTGHPNSSLGPSMPEAAPAGRSGTD